MKRLLMIFAVVMPMALQAATPSGEHLAYTVGCVNCHHQTDKHIINAPPLMIVRTYSISEFRKLMKTGITRSGRDMASQGSVMGFVAKEQFSHFSNAEVSALYEYFTKDWTAQNGIEEEKKIPIYFKPQKGKATHWP